MLVFLFFFALVWDDAHVPAVLLVCQCDGLVLPAPPNVCLLRALWSPLDGIWGVFEGSWEVLVHAVGNY